jgi:hypothetical protein
MKTSRSAISVWVLALHVFFVCSTNRTGLSTSQPVEKPGSASSGLMTPDLNRSASFNYGMGFWYPLPAS